MKKNAILSKAEKKATKLLEDKNLSWLLNGVSLRKMKKKEGEGKYVYDRDGSHTIYLLPDTELESVVLALLHECGHRLYVDNLSKEQLLKIKDKCKAEKDKIKKLSQNEKLKKLVGRKVLDLSIVEKVESVDKDKWNLFLKNGDRVEVTAKEALDFLYHEFGPSSNNNKTWFPSLYSTTNIAEWWAEIFAYWAYNDLSATAGKFVKSIISRAEPPSEQTVGAYLSKNSNISALDAILFLFDGSNILLVESSDLARKPGIWGVPVTTLYMDYIGIDQNKEQIYSELINTFPNSIKKYIEAASEARYFWLPDEFDGFIVAAYKTEAPLGIDLTDSLWYSGHQWVAVDEVLEAHPKMNGLINCFQI